MSENKRFEEWKQVDCNQCARYWDDSCDGVDAERHCTSYVATRSIVLPKRIEELEKDVKTLNVVIILLSIATILNSLSNIFW